MCESKPKQWNLQVTTTKLTEEEAELKGETEYIYLWSRSKRTPAGFATISVLYQKVRTSWEAGVKERLHDKWGSNFP